MVVLIRWQHVYLIYCYLIFISELKTNTYTEYTSPLSLHRFPFCTHPRPCIGIRSEVYTCYLTDLACIDKVPSSDLSVFFPSQDLDKKHQCNVPERT